MLYLNNTYTRVEGCKNAAAVAVYCVLGGGSTCGLKISHYGG